MNIPLLSRFDHHMHEVLRGASIAFVLKILDALLNFAFNVVLARLLGAEGAGMYFLALTVSTVAEVLGSFGLDGTVLRFAAAHAAVGDWQAVQGVYRQGMTLAFGVSSGVALVLCVTAPWLAATVFSQEALTTPIRIMACAAIPVTLFMLHVQLLKALKRVGEALAIHGVCAPALALLGVLLLAPSLGVHGVVWAYMLSAVVTLALAVVLWQRATPQLRQVSGHFDLHLLLASSMPLFWTSIFQMINRWSSTALLGIWATSAAVGLFNVASRTAALINFFLIAINSISAPKFAALYKQQDMEALGRTAQHSAMLITYIALPALLIFLLVPQWVMQIFGPQFVDHSVVLSILAIGQFANVATGSVQAMLVMCGHERLMRDVTIGCVILQISLSVLFVPLWGIMAAAVIDASIKILQNIVAAVLVKQKLGIWTLPIFRKVLVAK